MLFRTLAAVAILVTANAHAQTDPPPAPGAWALSVETTGGFAGRTSSVTITSEGQVRCRPVACAIQLTAEQTMALIAEVESLTPADWGPPQRSRFGTCHDCSRTTVTLTRREAGSIHTETAAWNGLQKAAPALSEVVRLARNARPAAG